MPSNWKPCDCSEANSESGIGVGVGVDVGIRQSGGLGAAPLATLHGSGVGLGQLAHGVGEGVGVGGSGVRQGSMGVGQWPRWSVRSVAVGVGVHVGVGVLVGTGVLRGHGRWSLVVRVTIVGMSPAVAGLGGSGWHSRSGGHYRGVGGRRPYRLRFARWAADTTPLPLHLIGGDCLCTLRLAVSIGIGDGCPEVVPCVITGGDVLRRGCGLDVLPAALSILGAGPTAKSSRWGHRQPGQRLETPRQPAG